MNILAKSCIITNKLIYLVTLLLPDLKCWIRPISVKWPSSTHLMISCNSTAPFLKRHHSINKTSATFYALPHNEREYQMKWKIRCGLFFQSLHNFRDQQISWQNIFAQDFNILAYKRNKRELYWSFIVMRSWIGYLNSIYCRKSPKNQFQTSQQQLTSA